MEYTTTVNVVVPSNVRWPPKDYLQYASMRSLKGKPEIGEFLSRLESGLHLGVVFVFQKKVPRRIRKIRHPRIHICHIGKCRNQTGAMEEAKCALRHLVSHPFADPPVFKTLNLVSKEP